MAFIYVSAVLHRNGDVCMTLLRVARVVGDIHIYVKIEILKLGCGISG